MSRFLDEVKGCAQAALIAGVIEPPDPARQEQAVDRIFALGPRALWPALVGWAQVCWSGEQADADGDFWGIEMVDDRTGMVVDPDAAVHDAEGWAAVQAMRFVAAKRNDDWDTMRAIFESPPDPEAAAHLVVIVLRLATQHVRALAQRGSS